MKERSLESLGEFNWHGPWCLTAAAAGKQAMATQANG